MKIIEVDEELYRYIASHTQHIGESASDILRRMLNYTPALETSDEKPLAPEKIISNTEEATAKYGALYLEELLDAGDIAAQKKAVNRFISLLSILYSIHPQQFDEATLSLHGRTRVYFAKDQQTLLENGNHTKPKQVLDTPYWVITNTNSERKRNMIEHIMKSMQFPDELISKAYALI
jgi:negative modulator of initiation of replication